MFLEPGYTDKKFGWIEVICGCMFSGKTEELIRRVNRAKIAKQNIKLFKPAVDSRYHASNIVSHNETSIEAIPISNPIEILSQVDFIEVVGIDEAQFFDNTIVEVCNALANKGIRVIVAGLDMDYQGKPFGSMPYLLAISEFVTKLHAICAKSGNLASYSYRKSDIQDEILLGSNKHYEARSRSQFYENE